MKNNSTSNEEWKKATFQKRNKGVRDTKYKTIYKSIKYEIQSTFFFIQKEKRNFLNYKEKKK